MGTQMNTNSRVRFVMLPPHSKRTRGWDERLATALPEYSIAVAQTAEQAEQMIVDADAVYGRDISPHLLRKARRLRWLQAPMSAPPAGYFYAELIAHPVIVTNMRDTFSDHIAAHIM